MQVSGTPHPLCVVCRISWIEPNIITSEVIFSALEDALTVMAMVSSSRLPPSLPQQNDAVTQNQGFTFPWTSSSESARCLSICGTKIETRAQMAQKFSNSLRLPHVKCDLVRLTLNSPCRLCAERRHLSELAAGHTLHLGGQVAALLCGRKPAGIPALLMEPHRGRSFAHNKPSKSAHTYD